MAVDLRQIARRLSPEGKALQPHPAFQDRNTPVSIVGPGTSGRNEARLTQHNAPHHLQAYGGRHEAIDWLMDAVDLVVQSASGAGYHFVQGGNVKLGRKDPQQPGTPLIDTRLGLLLEQPNPHQDYQEWLELMLIDLLLVGNAYTYKYATDDSGRPLALYRLAPPYVKVVPAPWGIKSYEYQLPGQRDPLQLDAGRVIHWRLPNPHNAYYGLGVVQKAGRALDVEIALTETQASYYENGASPSMVVSSDRRVPRDVIRKLRSQIRGRHTGPDKAGEALVLEAGLKADTISTDAREAAFEPITRLSRDRIFAMFRASPKLFGILDESGGADKIADAQRIFDNKFMVPLIGRFQGKLTRELTQAWDADFVIPYEYVMPVEDRWRLAASVAALPGLTVDEVRSAAGLGPHKDTTIGEMTLNLPGESAPPGGHPNVPDPNLPGEPGRPPNRDNTHAFPQNGDPLPKGAAAVPAGKALADILAELNDLEAKALGDPSPKVHTGRLDGEQAPVDLLAGRRESDVDVIVADLQRTLADASHTLERSLLDAVEGKAGLNTVRQRLRAAEGWRTFKDTVNAALRDAHKRLLTTAAVHQGSLGNRTDIDYDALADKLASRPEAKGVVRTFQNQVSRRVGDVLKANSDPVEVERAVRDAVTDWRTSQAETIALSEGVVGYNEGTLTIAEELGVDEVDVFDGDDHDEPCREANGQRWTLAKARDNLLEHPRCRRAFSFA